ncbi:hypothetical protein EDEG_00580 [Edhazardia aedis USNM 41457]|uniref:Septin-type G domain-containing protein n=1 Tax=Edhazardia aedis (strain USNM 41457) TaxID=1003232 RepID=J9DD05_EDHAE|nr:hypothetical protein EDEG_00580 [Edhazardia aedis USNM 41457]|eukprot:EJW05354.1 hypothetical protein EDEG_00580 [Edhazardia aedis USNM 41457]
MFIENDIPVLKYDKGAVEHPNTLGFENVPDLVRKRSKNHGFTLNLLIVGRRGLGTTTLMNTLFSAPLIDKARNDDLNSYTSQLFEHDISFTITVTTYHKEDYNVVLDYIENGNREYFKNEHEIGAPAGDSRVHICLYMVPNDRLTQDEINMMKKLSEKANFMPIISKADAYTDMELVNIKSKISKLMYEHNIPIFRPPLYTDDIEFTKEVELLVNRYPLAVFSGFDEQLLKGEIKLGRQYRWGFLSNEDESINDFLRLRRLVIANHLDDLLYSTENIFYDEFRKKTSLFELADIQDKPSKVYKIRSEMEKILTEKTNAVLSQLNLEVKNLEEEFEKKKLAIFGKSANQKSISSVN